MNVRAVLAFLGLFALVTSLNEARADDPAAFANQPSALFRYYDPAHGLHQSIGEVWLPFLFGSTPAGPDFPFHQEGPVISGYSALTSGPAYADFIAGGPRHKIFMCAARANGQLWSMFTSSDPNCEGQQFIQEAVALADSWSPVNPVPLFRCFNGADHMDSTNAAECLNNGYWIEGILGWGR